MGASLYTWQEAVIGFVIGSFIGIMLATLFVHSRFAERAFTPYVVASQAGPASASRSWMACTIDGV